MADFPATKQVEREIGTIQSFRELDDGLNTVYLLKAEKGEYILKERTNENNELEWFKAEPKIYKMMEKDNIPSPGIEYTDLTTESHENAFYLMEKLEGENPSSKRKEYSNKDLEEILYQYGKIMARIHEKHDNFQGYGLLKALNGELKVDDPAEKWYWALEGSMRSWKSIIEDEWTNSPRIDIPEKEYLGKVLPDKPGPVLTHLDNRLDNLLVQNEEITGFIDWSHPEVGHSEYDLVRAEYLLLEWDLDFKTEEEKQSLKEELYQGYKEEGCLEGQGFEERRQIYRYATVLWLMAGFPNWAQQWGEERKREMEDNLLERMKKERPDC